MDTVEQFFAELKGREHEPSLRRISGTIRYELARLERHGQGQRRRPLDWSPSTRES